MKAVPLVFSTPPEADFLPFLPSLRSHADQVFRPELKPHKDKALQRNTVVSWMDNNGYMSLASKILNCGTKYTHLKDANGHEKYAKMYCRNEQCPDCGDRGSRVHKTRSTRARDRLMWAPVLGYVVFTLPGDLARAHLTKDTLKAMEKAAADIVAEHFNAVGGLNRIHFAGNKLGKLQIHVNTLFPIEGTNGIGRVEEATLDKARDAWTDFVNKHFDRAEETTVLHYSFATTRPKKANKIKYVLRPIIDAFAFMLLTDEDKHYILSLRGWHNSRWFGKLSNSTYKKYLIEKGIDPKKHENDDPYLSKKCPLCGERFRFVDIVHKSELPLHRLRRIDNDTLVDFEIFTVLKGGPKKTWGKQDDTKKTPVRKFVATPTTQSIIHRDLFETQTQI